MNDCRIPKQAWQRWKAGERTIRPNSETKHCNMACAGTAGPLCTAPLQDTTSACCTIRIQTKHLHGLHHSCCSAKRIVDI